MYESHRFPVNSLVCLQAIPSRSQSIADLDAGEGTPLQGPLLALNSGYLGYIR